MSAGKFLHNKETGRVWFLCPGCNIHHQVKVEDRNSWRWNGSVDAPTLHPSVLVTGFLPLTDDEHQLVMSGTKVEPVPFVCHSFVTDGRVQFLDDCTHHLVGQTVDLPDAENRYVGDTK